MLSPVLLVVGVFWNEAQDRGRVKEAAEAAAQREAARNAEVDRRIQKLEQRDGLFLDIQLKLARIETKLQIAPAPDPATDPAFR